VSTQNGVAITQPDETAVIHAGNEESVTQPVPPEAFLTQMAFGALMTQALYVVAKLGVADMLAAGPSARPKSTPRSSRARACA
jgi:hypothetical protein